jgi:diguanylate cyclase (GGDEF)-like protein
VPKHLIRQLLLLLLFACSMAGAAEAPAPIALGAGVTQTPLDGHAQSWIEPGRSRSIEDIAGDESLDWQVRPAGRQDNLDGRTLWLRFSVSVQQAERWYLAVNSSGIDRVQLFHRDAAGRWVAEEAGDSKPVSQWPLPGRAPTFELAHGHGPSPEPVTYWLRVEHDRVDFAAPIVLYSQGALLSAREFEQFMFGCYFGVAMLLALVASANAAIWRDRNFAAYTVYLVVFTLGQAAYLGVGAQHLWDSALAWNAQSTFVLPGLSAAAALWFVQVVTEPARFSRWLQRIVFALIAALVIALVIDTVVPTRATLGIRLALTTCALAVVIALIGMVWTRGDDPDIRVIALGWVPVLVMALFPIARGFNLIPNGILTRYGLAIGAAIEMPILFYALNLRAARRREAQLRASALPRTDALTGLADRRSLLQRLDDSLARARSLKHTCALLLIKLSNHDQIASEYGRDTLDRALVVTGAYMRRAASDIDLAARVGEREFALLIEGPTSADIASSRAQQVVAGGLRQTQALPPDVVLRLSVAVATLPDEQPDAETTLQWLSAALAAIRPEARKQIRSVNF